MIAMRHREAPRMVRGPHCTAGREMGDDGIEPPTITV